MLKDDLEKFLNCKINNQEWTDIFANCMAILDQETIDDIVDKHSRTNMPNIYLMHYLIPAALRKLCGVDHE